MILLTFSRPFSANLKMNITSPQDTSETAYKDSLLYSKFQDSNEMLSSNTITGIILVISSIATALPTVTVNPLENDCSSYPSYNPTTKTAGPWEVIADSTNTSFDGFNVSAETFTNNGIDQFGFVRRKTSKHSQLKMMLTCDVGHCAQNCRPL
jgi:hypothetical protein